MKRINKLLFNNLGWKLISLLLAVILWFVCLNVEDPVESKLFDAALVLQNEAKVAENHYILLNEAELKNTKISVRIRASRSKLTELSRWPRSIRAYVDLAPIDIMSQRLGEPQAVTVALDVPLGVDDYEIIWQSATKVNVTMDKYVTDLKNINVDKLGEATEGYVSGKVEIEPAMISISGSQTILSQVDKVRVQVNLSGATRDVETKATPLVYDVDGKDITSQVELSRTEITVKVSIAKYERVPIALPKITGNVAEGYVLTDVIREPEVVEIVGSEEEVSKITGIELPAINISGETETKKTVFDLRDYLTSPEVAVRNGTRQDAMITAVIEKELIREFTLPVEKLRIEGMTSTVDLTTKEIMVTVKGAERVVNAIVPDSLYGMLDLKGLPDGSHLVAVQFEWPEDVVQVGEILIPVVITQQATETPAADEQALGED